MPLKDNFTYDRNEEYLQVVDFAKTRRFKPRFWNNTLLPLAKRVLQLGKVRLVKVSFREVEDRPVYIISAYTCTLEDMVAGISFNITPGPSGKADVRYCHLDDEKTGQAQHMTPDDLVKLMKRYCEE